MSDEEGMDPDDSFESSGGGSFSLSPSPPLSLCLPLSFSTPSPSSFKILTYTLEQSEEEYESPFEDDEKVLQSKYDQGCKFSLYLCKNPCSNTVLTLSMSSATRCKRQGKIRCESSTTCEELLHDSEADTCSKESCTVEIYLSLCSFVPMLPYLISCK